MCIFTQAPILSYMGAHRQGDKAGHLPPPHENIKLTRNLKNIVINKYCA